MRGTLGICPKVFPLFPSFYKFHGTMLKGHDKTENEVLNLFEIWHPFLLLLTE